MKIELHRTPPPPPTFAPMTLRITIQSEEELNALRCVAGLQTTIPDAVESMGEPADVVKAADRFLRHLNSVLSRE